MTTIAERHTALLARIRAAEAAAGRSAGEVRLVAVSKTFPAAAVREVVDAGVSDIGENYIQEARDKFEALQETRVSWHFIGHLQTNKAKPAVRMFDLIHTVDSYRLALEIDRWARKIHKVQAVLIQVNVAGEATKSGVAPEEALPLIRRAAALENLAVKGLMTMPPYFNAPEMVRPFFGALRRLRDAIEAEQVANINMNELSMGMTGDFEAAVSEGATLVRIGTALFGERA
jgi:pyridoxal phosphate enzyme (YggS family)